MPLTPALGRAEEFEGQSFEASLVYIVSSRTDKLHRDPVSNRNLLDPYKIFKNSVCSFVLSLCALPV